MAYNKNLRTANSLDVVELTRNLIRIPSYVHMYEGGRLVPQKQQVNEVLLLDYIVDFLQQHTNLIVRKQPVKDGRYNIIAANSSAPKLIMLGHTDTVRPSYGGAYDPFEAIIVDERLYGLGASDMKSGLACIMSAVALCKNPPDLMIILYVDEEYDFAGMIELQNLFSDHVPDLLLSADGNDMELGNGCRGLLEIHGRIMGVSAHASCPYLGINAINGTVDATRYLEKQLAFYKHEILGECSVNLARVNGGKASLNITNNRISVVSQPNSVPDCAEFIIDIRPASPEVSGTLVVNILNEYCNQHQLRLEGVEIKHNLGAWYTDRTELKSLEYAITKVTGKAVQYSSPRQRGYIDMQMLWKSLGMPPAAIIGPGRSEVCHQPDEYVEIGALVQTRDIFINAIESFC